MSGLGKRASRKGAALESSRWSGTDLQRGSGKDLGKERREEEGIWARLGDLGRRNAWLILICTVRCRHHTPLAAVQASSKFPQHSGSAGCDDLLPLSKPSMSAVFNKPRHNLPARTHAFLFFQPLRIR